LRELKLECVVVESGVVVMEWSGVVVKSFTEENKKTRNWLTRKKGHDLKMFILATPIRYSFNKLILLKLVSDCTQLILVFRVEAG
jgi:hypothetical protein